MIDDDTYPLMISPKYFLDLNHFFFAPWCWSCTDTEGYLLFTMFSPFILLNFTLQLGCHNHRLGGPLDPWKHRYSCSWGHSLKLFPFTWLQCIALPPSDTKPVHDPPFLRGQQQGLNRVKKETIFPVFTILIDFSFHLFPFGALRLQMFKWL